MTRGATHARLLLAREQSDRASHAGFARFWLLRFFDQIQFYPVSGPELLRFRNDFMLGRVKLSIEDTTFKLADYKRFLVRTYGFVQPLELSIARTALEMGDLESAKEHLFLAEKASPLAAATSGGIVRVFSGSRMPNVGLRRRCAMPVLACSGV